MIRLDLTRTEMKDLFNQVCVRFEMLEDLQAEEDPPDPDLEEVIERLRPLDEKVRSAFDQMMKEEMGES